MALPICNYGNSQYVLERYQDLPHCTAPAWTKAARYNRFGSSLSGQCHQDRAPHLGKDTDAKRSDRNGAWGHRNPLEAKLDGRNGGLEEVRICGKECRCTNLHCVCHCLGKDPADVAGSKLLERCCLHTLRTHPCQPYSVSSCVLVQMTSGMLHSGGCSRSAE